MIILDHLRAISQLSRGRSFTVDEYLQIEEALSNLEKVLAPSMMEARLRLEIETTPWTEC